MNQMASFYSRRAAWVAPAIAPRLYPHQDPAQRNEQIRTAQAQSPAQVPSPPRAPRDRQQGVNREREEDAPPPHSAPEPPPPLYYPGEAERARREQAAATAAEPLPAGTMASINVAYSRTATVEWVYHPTVASGFGRWLRPRLWWRTLAQNEREELWTGWPAEFGGIKRATTVGGRRSRPDEEADVEAVSRTTSRRSAGADSGIGLTPRSTMEPQHPLAKVYESRVAQVNKMIADALVGTRSLMAFLEMLWIVWFVVLVIAIGVDKGQQSIFLEVVEVALVLLFLLMGAGVNHVRMKRWALAKELRLLSRDWSPLPITSSTDRGVLNNFFSEPMQSVEEREALARRDQPTMRWSMRRTEGSWWLSYRPVIKVELITPGRSGRGGPAPAPAAPTPQPAPVEMQLHDPESHAAHPPGYDD